MRAVGGLTARFFPSLLQEGTPEALEFAKVSALLTEHFQPVGPIEDMLVQKIVVETIRSGRLVAREQNPKEYSYQSAINRQLFEALRELARWQEKRQAEERAAGEPEAQTTEQ